MKPTTRRPRAAVAGFVLVSVLPSAAMLLGLAVVARSATVEQWAALGVGGSVGALVGLVVLFGWRLVGPVAVARGGRAARQVVYAESLADRLRLLAAGVPVAAALATALVPAARAEALVMAVALCLTGLNATWFFVGTGEPWVCLTAEVLPRLVLTTTGAVVVLLGAPLVVFPLAVALGMGSGFAVVTRRLLGSQAPRLVAAAWPSSRARLRDHRTAAASEILAGGYTVASVAVVGAVATSGVTAAFSAGDRVFRGSLIPVSALASTLQPRVARATGEAFRREARGALVRHAAVGVAGLVALALLGPAATRQLFGDLGDLPDGAFSAYGVAFAAISVNSSLARHVLVPLDGTRQVMLGSLAGSVVGVIAMVVGATSAGVTGAVWGLAAGEVAVVAVLAGAATRAVATSSAR